MTKNSFARAWTARSSGACKRSGRRLVNAATGVTTYARRAVNHLPTGAGGGEAATAGSRSVSL